MLNVYRSSFPLIIIIGLQKAVILSLASFTLIFFGGSVLGNYCENNSKELNVDVSSWYGDYLLLLASWLVRLLVSI